MVELDGLIPQGDVLIEQVEAVPEDAREIGPTDGRHIVAHSETGHHHVVDATGCRMFRPDDDPLVCYLLAEGAYADIEHARPVYPHETVRFRGVVKITRQREWTPQGLRAVQD